MDLFIRMSDGQPVEHPIIADNFREAFPGIDPDNLPPEFARFTRIARPTPGPFQDVSGPTYEVIDGVVRDVWAVRDLSDDERATKIAGARAEGCVFPSWTLDEATLIWTPPTPRPEEGGPYRWDEGSVSWAAITPPAP